MADGLTNSSPSAASPKPISQLQQSHRYAGLQRLYKLSLDATLKTNSYPNFAACFPTPAKYCPRALEGVWKQLNTRLEEECLKDFDKLCSERGLEQALIEWEQLLDDAAVRKANVHATEPSEDVQKPIYMLTATQLHSAHLAPTLIKTEQELQTKLTAVQLRNQELAAKIEQQRAEMLSLVAQLETMVEDIEGAAVAIEQDPMRGEIKRGLTMPETKDDSMMSG